MVATAAQLEAALANFLDNLDNKLDVIVNGDSSTDVTTDSGTVPTIAKLFNQMTSSLTAGNNEFTASAAQTDFVCVGKDIPGVNSVIVSVDGSVQEASTYTIQTTTTSNDTVRLASGLAGGELVQVRLLAAPQSIGTADANAITYDQGSTGSSSRFVEDKLQTEMLSVLDFGADPTGTATSASAFSNAIDAAMATGRPLHVPTGTYNFSTWATKTTTADLTLIGDDGASINYTGGTPGTDYFLTPAHSLTLTNLEFTGFDRVVSQATHGGTRIDRFVFTNNKVSDCGGSCIYMLQPFASADVSNNIFDGSVTPQTVTSFILIGVGGSGTEGDYRHLSFSRNIFDSFDLETAGTARIVDIMAEKSYIEENLIRQTERTANTNPVELMRVVGNQNTIRNNIFDTFTNTSSSATVFTLRVQGQDVGTALPAAPSSAATALYGHSNIIEGNRITTVGGATTGYGIYCTSEDAIIRGNVIDNITGSGSAYGLLYSSNSDAGSVVVSGNIALGGCKDAFYIDTDGMATISGNAASGFTRYGIFASTNNGVGYTGSLANNALMDNGTATASSSACIIVQAGDWTVAGNTCYGTVADYGVYVASVTDGCVITGNRAEITTGTGVRLVNNSANGEGHIVTSNSIQNCTTGITKDSGGDHKVSNNIVDGSVDTVPGVLFAGTFDCSAAASVWTVTGTNLINYANSSNISATAVRLNFTDSPPDANYIVVAGTFSLNSATADPKLLYVSKSTAGVTLQFDGGTSANNEIVEVVCYRF